jgi:hypothetical protein
MSTVPSEPGIEGIEEEGGRRPPRTRSYSRLLAQGRP